MPPIMPGLMDEMFERLVSLEKRVAVLEGGAAVKGKEDDPPQRPPSLIEENPPMRTHTGHTHHPAIEEHPKKTPAKKR